MTRNLRSIVAKVGGGRGSFVSHRKSSSPSGSKENRDTDNYHPAFMVVFLVVVYGGLYREYRSYQKTETGEGNGKQAKANENA